MAEHSAPIRVVLFGGGPVLEQGVREFICRLESHPEIDFAGAFCQSEGQTFPAVVRDLWRRRGLLVVPLVLLDLAERGRRSLVRRSAESALNRTMSRLTDRIHYVPDIHANEVLEDVRSLKPDLGLVYGSPILKPELFRIPRLGTLGVHHGKVPEYRGKKTTFWAMYNGEETAGVTIQKVDGGLDTGQIVKEGEVEIGRRSLGAVWDELETLGFEVYIQAILEVRAGTAAYRPQVKTGSRLYRDPRPGDILAFWRHQLARRIHGV